MMVTLTIHETFAGSTYSKRVGAGRKRGVVTYKPPDNFT